MTSRFQEEYKRKLLSIEEAAKLIKSGDKIVGAIATGEPTAILDAIGKRAIAKEFENVEYICQGPNATSNWIKPEIAPHMRLNTGFIVNPIGRVGVNKGYADYTPMHGGDFPDILIDYMINDRASGTTKIGIMVTPMDHLGYFCLGTGPGYTLEAAKLDHTTVIVQVNENMPYIGGDNFIHISDVDYIVEHNQPMVLAPSPEPSPEDIAIASNVAELIEDGATLQLGFGTMPNVLGKLLKDKRNLGAHSEQIGDAFMELWYAGALTGSRKTVKPGKITGTFSWGSAALFEWQKNNPALELYTQKWTNNPFVIAQNYKMTAINQALEIDLTGQAASESIGPRQYSGTGGQAHFVQGAVYSPGGKSIICLHSTANTKEGRVSNIVPMLKHGAMITTSRNDMQYVATEYGVAQLRGKSVRQRAQELINIAYPDFREELRREASRLFYL